MSGPWFQAGAIFLVAVVIVSAGSSNDDLFPNMVRERSNCKKGICRRNVDRNSAEIVEKDTISRLSNLFGEGKKAIVKRRCMGWWCKNGRTIRDDLNFNNDKIITQDKRAQFKRVVKPKRCLQWKCKQKRTAQKIENAQEITSKPAKKCLGWKCFGKRANENKRKYKSFDSKRLVLTQVMQRQGDVESEGCLSWDCKREADADIAVDKKEANTDLDSDVREHLTERSYPRFKWEWSGK